MLVPCHIACTASPPLRSNIVGDLDAVVATGIVDRVVALADAPAIDIVRGGRVVGQRVVARTADIDIVAAQTGEGVVGAVAGAVQADTDQWSV